MVFKNKLIKGFYTLFIQYKWNVGVVRIPIAKFLDHPGKMDVSWMDIPGGLNFNADPFGLNRKGELEIYFEHYNAIEKKGMISSVKFQNGVFTAAEKIMENGVHLSYPFIISENGQHFMIPEQGLSNEISLFKLNDKKLEKIKTLVPNFSGVDTSVIQWNGKWWMFCTDQKLKGADLRLYIFYADELLGDWQPHNLNPVKTDISSARPGGTPFINDGILYRPSQDSSRTYGGRIIINKVIILTPDLFEETPVTVVEPSQFNGKYTKGTHTLSACGEVTLIDAKESVYSFSNFLRILRKNNFTTGINEN